MRSSYYKKVPFLKEGHHSYFTTPRQEHSEKEMELKPKVVTNPFQWKGTR